MKTEPLCDEQALYEIRRRQIKPVHARRKNAVQALYADLSDSNFSREILQARATDLAVLPVGGLKWSDLGSPHRVFSTLSDLGGTSLIKREPIGHLMKLQEGFYERARIRGSEAV